MPPVTVALAGASVLAAAISVAGARTGPLAPTRDGGWPCLLAAPFAHGFSPASAVPHLVGNLLLPLYAGARVGRRLGSLRFTVLTVGALTAYVVIELIGRLEVNGASVFIWAYAPPLAAVHVRAFEDHHPLRGPPWWCSSSCGAWCPVS